MDTLMIQRYQRRRRVENFLFVSAGNISRLASLGCIIVALGGLAPSWSPVLEGSALALFLLGDVFRVAGGKGSFFDTFRLKRKVR